MDPHRVPDSDLFLHYEASRDPRTLAEIRARGLGHALETFGTIASGPVIATHTPGGPFRYRFNSDASVVIAISSTAADAGHLRFAIMSKLAAAGQLRAVVFEAFEGTQSVAVEVGDQVPRAVASIVVSACIDGGVFTGTEGAEIYLIDDDGRVGYCQRVYIGSRTPSGRRLTSSEIAALLDVQGT